MEEERPGYAPRVQVVLLQRAILMNEKKDKHGLFRLPGHVHIIIPHFFNRHSSFRLIRVE